MVRRELSDADALRQVHALIDFVSRGGSERDWFASKNFLKADEGAILAKRDAISGLGRTGVG